MGFVWTKEKISKLRAMVDTGYCYRELSDALEVSMQSVKKARLRYYPEATVRRDGPTKTEIVEAYKQSGSTYAVAQELIISRYLVRKNLTDKELSQYSIQHGRPNANRGRNTP